MVLPIHFQPRRILLDGMAAVVVLLLLGLPFPSSSQQSSAPPGIVYSVPITLTNNQPSPTPAPFQQMISVNSATYASYEAPNLQNVEFYYPDGAIIPSWLESGNSNFATDTVYWLELAGGIPAGSNLVVYMGFAQPSVNLLNAQTTGEAPNISPTYGQYDTGPAVFPYYQAWGGLSVLPDGWTITGQAKASFLSTHATFTDSDTSAGGNDGVTSSAPAMATSFPSIVEYYGNQYLGSGGYSTIFGLLSNLPGPGSVVAAGIAEASGSPILGLDIADTGYNSAVMDTIQNNVYTLAVSSQTSANLLYNYNPVLSESNTGTITPDRLGLYWHVQFCCQTNYPFNLYWLRTRAYAPNGVMPTVSGVTTGVTTTQGATTTSTSTIAANSPTVTLFPSAVTALTATINGITQPTTAGATITSLTWQWGDGQTTTGFFPQTHTYAQSGTYNVVVTATDSNGLTGSASESVSVGGLASSSTSQATSSGSSLWLSVAIIAVVVVIVALAGFIVLLRRRRRTPTAPAPSAPLVTTQAPPVSPQVAQKLQQLKAMLDAGLITQEDYNDQKRKLTG